MKYVILKMWGHNSSSYRLSAIFVVVFKVFPELKHLGNLIKDVKEETYIC